MTVFIGKAALILSGGAAVNFDWTILHWIQNTLVCPAMDFLMPKITLLGNGGAVWILAAVDLLATKKYRKYGAFLLAGLAIGVLIGNLTPKPLIARPRPCWLDESVQLLIANLTDYSFPSGHTLSSVIGATVLTKANRKFGLRPFRSRRSSRFPGSISTSTSRRISSPQPCWAWRLDF